MTAKIEIVERLGESAVLLPSLIAEALAANDRLKLRMTALQEAAEQAAAPRPRAMPAADGAPGPDGVALGMLIAASRRLDSGRLFLPGVAAVLAGLSADLAVMLEPIRIAGVAGRDDFAARLAALQAALPAGDGDQLALQDIAAITALRHGGADSVHRLVMDLHRAVNRLAADTAVETLDGARVHRLAAGDRLRVIAFMRGLNRTKPLAFGHPGLDTTATRTDTRLVIENDIGTTDAHILVIHVEDRTVSITYTDVHRPRAKFFQSMFARHDVAWSNLAEQEADGLGEDDVFYLVTGRYMAGDDAALDAFLEFLGSRIVFLIDWNKGRKALQTFVGKNVAIDLLGWAAAHDYGHRAFLELGGIDLIFEAVRRVAAGRIPYGIRLDHALGTVTCADFLRGVLRDSSQGLAGGRTARLIRDEIQADLSQRFETAESAVLTELVRHLGLSRMLAGAIADALSGPAPAALAERQILARQAKRMEEKADRLTVTARETASRIRDAQLLRPIIDEIENVADALDESAWLLSLMPEPGATGIVVAPLVELAGITTESVGHLVRAVEAASKLPEGRRADAVDSLQSIDAVVNAERRADLAERNTIGALMMTPCSDARLLTLGLEIARSLEVATDHLSHAALSLRDRVLEELSA